MGGDTGARVSTTEIWSGTAWSTTSSLTEARYGLSGCGTTSAALCFGGYTDANVDTTEKWFGVSWSTTTSLNIARRIFAGCGTTSAALCFGGYTDTITSTTEKWVMPIYPLLEDVKSDIRAKDYSLTNLKVGIEAGSYSLADLKVYIRAGNECIEDVKVSLQGGRENHEDLKADVRAWDGVSQCLESLQTDIRSRQWLREDFKTSIQVAFDTLLYVKTDVACAYAQDVEPPYVERYPEPYEGDVEVKRSAPILFYISDDGWGVDIDSIWVEIDGVKYQNGDPEFAYTGSPNSYKVIVRPINDWAYNQIITVRIFGKDLAGNPGLDLEPI